MFSKPIVYALSAALLTLANPAFSEQQDSYQVGAISSGDLKEAEQVLRAILATNPEDPYALLNLAAVYQQSGQQEKARFVYEQIIKLRDNPMAELASGKPQRVKTIARKGLDVLEE